MTAVLPFVFALGALVGIAMAVTHFRGKESPVGWGWLHGAFVLSGIVMLVVLLLGAGEEGRGEPGTGWLILGLFVLAALAGGFLYVRQQQGKPWPGLVILAHGATALTAVVLLTLWLLSYYGA